MYCWGGGSSSVRVNDMDVMYLYWLHINDFLLISAHSCIKPCIRIVGSPFHLFLLVGFSIKKNKTKKNKTKKNKK